MRPAHRLPTWALVWAVVWALGAAGTARAAGAAGAQVPSAEVEALLAWVARSQDHRGRAFAVLDKQQASLWVFDANGRRLAQSPVLLGLARGDDSVPGIGERPMSAIRPDERTTPAGRFRLEPGVNADGEDVLWVDYDAAVSMHRVRAVNPVERRLERLASPTPADNRISYGCINVPAHFYDQQLRPLVGTGRSVLYVLPETRPVEALFEARRPGPTSTAPAPRP